MSIASNTRIHVQRFHDKVAVDTGTGETVYISPEMARRVGFALGEFASDITSRKFNYSVLNTQEFEEE